MATTYLPGASRPANPLRRLITAAEPWYDWGKTFIERMEAAGEGPGYFVSLQWLGINFTLFFGRTPKLEVARPAAPRVVQDHTNFAAASAAIASQLGGAA
jgi:hypothetical protein